MKRIGMWATSAAAAAMLLASGCNKAPEAGKEGGETALSGAPTALAEIRFQPGQWQATSELVKMEAPGLPPEIAKANVGQKATFEHCMTAEQAAKPSSDFFANNSKTTDCTSKKFAMVGGKLDAAMSCTDRNSKTRMDMTIQGDYQPTQYAATMTMVTEHPGGEGKMTITARTSGKRIGDCTAKAVGEAPAKSD